jgi:23S rRNA-/tRNA-specific pseudouridylate synthase
MELENIIDNLNNLEIKHQYNDNDIKCIIKIQSLWRGLIYKKYNLPNSIKLLHKIIKESNIKCSNDMDDGRTNSCIDEGKVIKILKTKKELQNRLHIPDKRHWFDIAIKDYKNGWLPINIKTTTMKTADNTGNLAMCVYALTNYDMKIEKTYQNGKMSQILIECFKQKKINNIRYRDYYFLVINKNTQDVIINSMKGLDKLTPNINNLPFQILWNDNKKYSYKPINQIIKTFIKIIKKPKPSWQELFLKEIRGLD